MRWIALPLICLAISGFAATAATARTETHPLLRSTTPASAGGLATGIGDPLFAGPQAPAAFAMTRDAGATYARVFVAWSSIAPKALPASWNPRDPNSPYYSWSALDTTVNAANANGVTPILNIVSAPSWGYHVAPGNFTGGQPDLTALGQFATALAKHYDGAHPAAHVFSVWNEPNFNRNLFPQDPVYYRSMVNAVADAVHAVDPSDIVGAGELAPYKHKPVGVDKNSVSPPLAFMQSMLCLSSTKNASLTCPAGSAHFDVWNHHPYSDTGPFGHSRASGGIELGDLPKMNSLLQMAWDLGAISSNDPKSQPFPFWVTEVGWSTKPPNKHGVPIGLESRWMSETMYQMWKSNVTVGTWFLLQDEPTNTPFQSGLYTHTASLASAQPKALLQPFSFPVVGYLKSHGNVLIWGRDATSDRRDVQIQMKVGRTWKNVATITSNKYGVFTDTVGIGAKSKYQIRAQATGSGTSLGFALKVPSNENLRVTPFPAG